MEQNKAQDVQEAAKEYAKREACNGSIPDMVASMIKLEQAVLYGASLTSRQLPSVEECVGVQYLKDRKIYLYQQEFAAIQELDDLAVGSPERQLKWNFIRELTARRDEIEQLIHYSQGKTK